MIYGNKFYGYINENNTEILNEAGNNKEITAIYKEKKSIIDENLKGSRESFKNKDYKKAITYCKNIISAADSLIKELNKITPEGALAKFNKNKYLGYANYMKQDATIAIGQAKDEMNKK